MNIRVLIIFLLIAGLGRSGNPVSPVLPGKIVLMPDFSRGLFYDASVGTGFHLPPYHTTRPTFSFENTIMYKPMRVFSAGVGVGLELFPDGLALPAYLRTTAYLGASGHQIFLNNDFGRYFELWDGSFAAWRNHLSIGYRRFSWDHRIGWQASIGWLSLWDQYGGNAHDITIRAGVSINISGPTFNRP